MPLKVKTQWRRNVSQWDGSSRPTFKSGTARAVPLLKVGRLVMHFAVPLFGHRLHIALMIDGRTVLCGVYISHCQ